MKATATDRILYNSLRRGEYQELPEVVGEEIEIALRAWEAAHPDRLVKIRRKGFFGALNVANGKLKRRTSVNLIPAVKDAATEINDGKRSPVLQLLQTITDQTINRQEYQAYYEEALAKFTALTDPASIPQLGNIGEGLTNCLQQYYSDANLVADWERLDPISVNFPTPRLSVGHREVGTGVEFVGHGLQRAILFAIMQYLAENEPRGEPVTATYDVAQSDIMILIEEPEIYQHPSKQVLIYEALAKIVEAFNTETGIRFQIIYTTHSEKLVDVTNFGGVRIIRKELLSGAKLRTLCSSYTLDECRCKMAEIVGAQVPMSKTAFAAKLHIITREVSEGFFASRIILVEGVTDRAILEGAYRSVGRSPRKENICIISMDGKTKIDKPALIFLI